jgi:hypothetical protein
MRWNNNPDANGIVNASIVVKRSDDAGIDRFNDLGARGAAFVTTNIPSTTTTANTSLGDERLGSSLSLAVDPRNPCHVYVAYADVPTLGEIQVHVWESTNSGANWHPVFQTDPAFKSALPALAVAGDGSVGLLYTAQGTLNGNASLETHFVETSDDFAHVPTDTVLSEFGNGTPKRSYDPYIGDYEALKAVGNTFYGSFAASNQDDGVNSVFPQGVRFQQNYVKGKPSIDPFYFAVTTVSTLESAPTLLQSGQLGGDDVFDYFPSVEIAPNGDVGMTYLESSHKEFMSMYVTGRTSTDPVGTMEPPQLVQAGQGHYADASFAPYRAGDYSSVSLDPLTDTFWAANEYATSPNPPNPNTTTLS